ncbi:MAG: hypothetical protein LW694_09785, partial [Chitinophagaceae bacterium]|nr:hypothetical protein [Chitinophagaceae bacterium]
MFSLGGLPHLCGVRPLSFKTLRNIMIRLFYINASGEIKWEKRPANLEPSEAGRVVWVDLQSPTAAEKRQVESHF